MCAQLHALPRHASLVRKGYFYILSNRPNGTLYAGVTNDIIRRTWEHKTGEPKSFTSRYRLTRLVYFEVYDSILEAIDREKQVKNWKRRWKIALIEKDNPRWDDLYYHLVESWLS